MKNETRNYGVAFIKENAFYYVYAYDCTTTQVCAGTWRFLQSGEQTPIRLFTKNEAEKISKALADKKHDTFIIKKVESKTKKKGKQNESYRREKFGSSFVKRACCEGRQV